MKLHRACAFAVLLVAMTGCGTRAVTPISSASNARHADSVSSVQLTAANIRETDDAPKVSKSQRSDSSVIDDEEGKREESSRGSLDRKRGGFSGYK